MALSVLLLRLLLFLPHQINNSNLMMAITVSARGLPIDINDLSAIKRTILITLNATRILRPTTFALLAVFLHY